MIHGIDSLISRPLLGSSEEDRTGFASTGVSSGNQSPHPCVPLGQSPKPRGHRAACSAANGWTWSYVRTHHGLSEFGSIIFFNETILLFAEALILMEPRKVLTKRSEVTSKKWEYAPAERALELARYPPPLVEGCDSKMQTMTPTWTAGLDEVSVIL